jgi:putative ABC transport system permease protein
MVESLLRDICHAARHLRRSPGFALGATLTLALGIGATTAMFSVLHALVLRTLPVRAPSELVSARGYSHEGQPRLTLVTTLPLLDEAPGPLTGYCAWNGDLVLTVEANGRPTAAVIDFMTAGCFETLGLVPTHGRLYTPAEAPLTSAGTRVALIRHRFWQRMFGGDPAVVGKRIRAEGVEIEIIGVLPPGYEGVSVDTGADIVAPFGSILPAPAGRPPGATYVLARLRPDATLAQARAHLVPRWPAIVDAVIPSGLPAPDQQHFRDVTVRVESFANGISFLRQRYLQSLQISLGLTAVLLVLVCLNLGGLLLARLTSREDEIFVRRALGATNVRLAQQLSAESLLVALAGTALGVPLAFLFVDAIDALLPAGLTARVMTLSPDLRVLAITMLAGLLTGALISFVPVLALTSATRRGPSQWQRTIASAGSLRSKALMVAQVALCSVLVVGAGLLSQSLTALQSVETGVRTDNVLSVRLMPVPNGYERFDAASYYPVLLDRLAALPSVRRVGYARMFPNSTTANPQLAPVSVDGEPDRGVGAQLDAVSPGFFDTIGIRVQRGRGFEPSDDPRSQSVAVVNEQLARQLAPDGDPVGRRISYGTEPSRQHIEVVGVVTNATLGSFRATATPIVYLSALQAGRIGYYPTLQIATAGEPMRLADRVEQIVTDMGHEYVQTVLPLRAWLERSATTERLAAAVANATALLGTALALMGLYALLAYSVARRTREIGVRLALGATPKSVRLLVMRDGVGLMLIGVAIGVPLSLWPARVLESLLFGVSPADPWTLAGTALLFAVVGVLGGLLPARRAATVDPVTALRAD